MAISLFATLSLLGKAYVCVKSNEDNVYSDFFKENNHAKDEQKIFLELVSLVHPESNMFSVGAPSNRQAKRVWEYFRDYTTHLLVPDAGHKVITCAWREKQTKSASAVLEDIRCDNDIFCFVKLKDGGWEINVDKILALTPGIEQIVTNYLKGHKKVCARDCSDKLESVLWRQAQS